MKTIIKLLVFGLCLNNVAAEALMDRQGLIKVVVKSFDASVCNKPNNTCMGVTEKACLAETKKILIDKCSGDIPDELENIKELSSYMVSATTCVIVEYNKIHNEMLVKNKNIPVCQEFSKVRNK
jgi:hypothetical protein